jgi:Zn-dependent peptidase ImmA (M78 family)
MRHIIEKANQIRRKYGSDDLNFVVSELKAHLFEIPLEEIVKEIYFKDLKAIVVDPTLHFYRKRHLIAHALGHHLLHQKSRANYFIHLDKDFLEGLKVRKMEKEAEIFAAYFLIPKEKLASLLKQEWIQESPNPVLELANEFEVTEELMRKRLEFEEMLPS